MELDIWYLTNNNILPCKDLGIAASIGKSLLDNNIALKARQDALLQRVHHSQHRQSASMSSPGTPSREPSIYDYPSTRSPPSSTISPSSERGNNKLHRETILKPTIVPFQSLIPSPVMYGAHGDYIEGRPPPSPGPSSMSRRSSIVSRLGLDPDVLAFHRSRRASVDSNTSHRFTTSPLSSPNKIPRVSIESLFPNAAARRSRSHSESSSSTGFGAAKTPERHLTMTHSASSKSISELYYASQAQHQQLHLEIQHLRLSEQNTELESKLQELEHELTRADITGKKRLRRLDKELLGLKKELESALERNKELEDRLSTKSSNGSNGPRRDVAVDDIALWTRDKTTALLAMQPALVRSPRESTMPTDTDRDRPVTPEESGTWEMQGEIGTITDNADTASHNDIAPHHTTLREELEPASSRQDQLTAQLFAKIKELEETNASIASHDRQLSDKLAKASKQFDDMKRKYEFLEERVIEAEIRNHRILELEDEAGLNGLQDFPAIEWRTREEQADDQDVGPVVGCTSFD